MKDHKRQSHSFGSGLGDDVEMRSRTRMMRSRDPDEDPNDENLGVNEDEGKRVSSKYPLRLEFGLSWVINENARSCQGLRFWQRDNRSFFLFFLRKTFFQLFSSFSLAIFFF